MPESGDSRHANSWSERKSFSDTVFAAGLPFGNRKPSKDESSAICADLDSFFDGVRKMLRYPSILIFAVHALRIIATNNGR